MIDLHFHFENMQQLVGFMSALETAEIGPAPARSVQTTQPGTVVLPSEPDADVLAVYQAKIKAGLTDPEDHTDKPKAKKKRGRPAKKLAQGELGVKPPAELTKDKSESSFESVPFSWRATGGQAGKVAASEESIKELLAELIEKQGLLRAKDILKDFGATRVADLSEDAYPQIYACLNEILYGEI